MLSYIRVDAHLLPHKPAAMADTTTAFTSITFTRGMCRSEFDQLVRDLEQYIQPTPDPLPTKISDCEIRVLRSPNPVAWYAGAIGEVFYARRKTPLMYTVPFAGYTQDIPASDCMEVSRA